MPTTLKNSPKELDLKYYDSTYLLFVSSPFWRATLSYRNTESSVSFRYVIERW